MTLHFIRRYLQPGTSEFSLPITQKPSGQCKLLNENLSIPLPELPCIFITTIMANEQLDHLHSLAVSVAFGNLGRALISGLDRACNE
jgi:hypothetical protein